MSCDLYAALEQLYSSGLYSCVVELYPFVGASQTLSAAEAANGALYQVPMYSRDSVTNYIH